jgi:hypothetical protein
MIYEHRQEGKTLWISPPFNAAFVGWLKKRINRVDYTYIREEKAWLISDPSAFPDILAKLRSLFPEHFEHQEKKKEDPRKEKYKNAYSGGSNYTRPPVAGSAYSALYVVSQAPNEVVKAAYRALCKLYHPDLASNKDEAEMAMKNINNAYDTISKERGL